MFIFPSPYVSSGSSSTGWTIAGSGATVDTDNSAWGNPSYITADDSTDSSATVGVIVGSPTDTLKGYNFGLSVPGGATIDGVMVRAQLAYANTVSGTPTYSYANIGKDDSTLGTNKTPGYSLTTTMIDYDQGSSSDLWGLTLSAAEVNASTFQARIKCANTGNLQTARCDAMWINVYYTV